MALFAVTAVGSDRPGIVAATSAGLLELAGDVGGASASRRRRRQLEGSAASLAESSSPEPSGS